MTNASIVNPHGSALHLWRTFNTVIDGISISGVGSGKIWTAYPFEAYAFTVWGGDGLLFRNVEIAGSDIGGFNTEVGVKDVHVDGLRFDVTFTAAREYASSPLVFGFSSIGPVHITNAIVKAITTGGSSHVYFGYGAQFVLDGSLVFPGSSLTDWLDYGYQRRLALNGTVTIGNVTYGPPTTATLTSAISPGASFRTISVPKGIYTSAALRMTAQGDLRDVSDSFGAIYWDAIKTGQTAGLSPDKWLQIGPGDAALDAYMNKSLTFWLNNSGSTADAQIELIVTYLPVTAAASPAMPTNLPTVN